MFFLFEAGHGWLARPADEWRDNADYLNMLDKVQSIKVVNDAAERGVKDVTDFANASQDGANLGRIILVSNSHRVRIPSFQKNEMEENM